MKKTRIKKSRDTVPLKILKFFDGDPDPGSGIFLTLDPGWKKFGSGIRDKHPGSATLLARISRIRKI
jgi:hypothetical protein